MARISAPHISDSAVSFELTVSTVEEFRERIASTLARYPWLACTSDGEIVEYAYVGQHSPRASYGWSVDVSVYVDERHRKRGVDRALYTSVFACLCLQGVLQSVLWHHAAEYRERRTPRARGVRAHRGLPRRKVQGVPHQQHSLSDAPIEHDAGSA